MKAVEAVVDFFGMAAAALLILLPSLFVLSAIFVFSFLCAQFI